MKVTNIILSILILLLAIALAVSSFFLYEKREIMINGWEKLTGTINKTAQELDKDSGTNNAEKLTQNALAHTNYATLDDKLKELDKAAADLINQRNNLAASLVAVAEILEAEAPKTESLTKLDSSPKTAKEIEAQAKQFKQRRDAAYQRLAASGRLLGVQVNINDLKSGNSAKIFNAFDAKIKSLFAQLSEYQRLSREIGKSAGYTGSYNFNVNTYKTTLSKIHSSVKTLKDKYNKSQRDLAATRDTVKKHEGTIASNKRAIESLNKKIQAKDKTIKDYRKTLGLEKNEPVNPWEHGCKEAKLAVKGKVIEINTKFGFYVVDIGNDTRVNQTIGNRTNAFNPKIVPNMTLTITRNMDTPDVKFISKGKITNVANTCSIVELTNHASSNGPVMVGDDVYFDAKDLK